MTVPLYKGEFGTQRQTRTQGEYQMSVKAENGAMLLQAKQHQRLAANPQKRRERPGLDSLPQPQRNQPDRHMARGLLATRTVRKYIVV